jgi:hypothetical protein
MKLWLLIWNVLLSRAFWWKAQLSLLTPVTTSACDNASGVMSRKMSKKLIGTIRLHRSRRSGMGLDGS